ncbi:MAG: bacteriohopanetetrol glucosamine biosynthesis glycosyltransferase HpnI [Steroidobacteraceae bacterium]
MNIAEAISLIRSLGDGCLLGAFVGCIFMLVAAACVLGFPEQETAAPATLPPVTVLKPLHGVEPGLPARLAAFCRQESNAPVQVLCGAQDHASPAVAAVRGLKADFPDAAIELAIDPRSHGVNRKVSNLINLMPRARHDTLVLSDSDIVVGPGYLRALTALLGSPRVGAVTCLYHGICGEGLWTRLSALAINSQFLPQAVTAVSLGLAKPCCGATIALRRSTLDRIGGFVAFADVLADDHAIGLAVRSAGYDVVTAPFLVGHRCFESSFRQLLLHQIRIARTIRSIDPIAYAGTIVTHPWPLALISLLSGRPAAVLVALAVLVSRVMLCRCVEWRFGLPRQNYWLILLQDVIAFAVYVASFFGATVHWRGADYRVTAAGTLIEGQDLRGT